MNNLVFSPKGEIVFVFVFVRIYFISLAVLDDDFGDEPAGNEIMRVVGWFDGDKGHIVHLVHHDIWGNIFRYYPNTFQHILFFCLVQLQTCHFPFLCVHILMNSQKYDPSISVQKPAYGLLKDVGPGLVKWKWVVFIFQEEILGLLNNLLVNEIGPATHGGNFLSHRFGFGFWNFIFYFHLSSLLLNFVLILSVDSICLQFEKLLVVEF